MEEEQKYKFIKSNQGIIIARWILILGLGFVGIVQRITGINVSSLSPVRLSLLVIISVLYNLFFSLYIRRQPKNIRLTSLKIFGVIQVVVDLMMITGLVYYTGGIESVNFFVYLFPLLVVTILFSSVEIVFFAFFVVMLYTGLIALEYNRIIPHLSRYQHDAGIFGNIADTLLNTMTIDLLILILSVLAIVVNRLLHERELQLTIERDKVRSILNSLIEGIVMIDVDSNILSINPPARAMLRIYDDRQKIGSLFKKNFPTSFQPLIEAILLQPKKQKELSQELIIEDLDSKIYMQVDAIPIKNSVDQIISWVKVLRDITQDKELDQMKSEFISVAAHQLRTPLSGLKWFFKLMADGDTGKLNAKQQELLDQAYVKNNQVIEIINDLLDVSELEEGKAQYQFKEEKLGNILDTVVAKSKIDAKQKKVKIDYQKRKQNIPPVNMDKLKLTMVFQNILDNAIKYSPPKATVKVVFDFQNNQNFVSITDAGIGISKEEQQKIFSKFFRASNAKEAESNGSGLGLYIARNIVKKHHGQIWFKSSGKNQGTVFYITLPVSQRFLSW